MVNKDYHRIDRQTASNPI